MASYYFDFGVRENRGIKVRGLLGPIVKPQEWRDFGIGLLLRYLSNLYWKCEISSGTSHRRYELP
jgi:hypothetical protein